jgi:hypothetical protein
MLCNTEDNRIAAQKERYSPSAPDKFVARTRLTNIWLKHGGK